MNTAQTISFIGAGNMANSIVGGLLARNFPAERIWVSSPDDEHLQASAQPFRCQCHHR